MNGLISLVAGLGLALIVAGIPRSRMPSLKQRVEPYVAGWRDRRGPDGRRRPGRSAGRIHLERLLSRFSIASNDELLARLESAGRKASVVAFRIEQLLWGISGVAAATAALAFASMVGARFELWTVPASIAIVGTTAVLGRDKWLTRQVQSRRQCIIEEIPVGLDLAALAVMAGESVPASLARAGEILTGPFGHELRRLTSEIRAGSSSVEALEGLRRRCDLASVDRFVQAVLIAMERGAPLAEVLRTQVEDAREIRRRRLMEIAGRREILMLVPVVFILMPTVILFALYPALVSLELVVP